MQKKVGTSGTTGSARVTIKLFPFQALSYSDAASGGSRDTRDRISQEPTAPDGELADEDTIKSMLSSTFGYNPTGFDVLIFEDCFRDNGTVEAFVGTVMSNRDRWHALLHLTVVLNGCQLSPVTRVSYTPPSQAWEDFWAKAVQQIKDGGLCFHDEWEVTIVVPDGPGVKEAIGATLLQFGGQLPFVNIPVLRIRDRAR